MSQIGMPSGRQTRPIPLSRSQARIACSTGPGTSVEPSHQRLTLRGVTDRRRAASCSESLKFWRPIPNSADDIMSISYRTICPTAIVKMTERPHSRGDMRHLAQVLGRVPNCQNPITFQGCLSAPPDGNGPHHSVLFLASKCMVGVCNFAVPEKILILKTADNRPCEVVY